MSTARRTVIKGAAWSLPAIAASVVAPLAAATSADQPTVCGGYHQSGNNGHYLVYPDMIVIGFRTAPDIYEVNVRYADGSSQSFGTNYGTAPERGTLSWTIPLRSPAAWIQVHGFNDHYGEVC